MNKKEYLSPSISFTAYADPITLSGLSAGQPFDDILEDPFK